jgi:transcriptional regulator with XRE-family HTH domain
MPPSDRPETPSAMWGVMLKHYRERAELSQERLAQRVNYSSAQIASIETGRRRPSEELAKLCDEATGAEGTLTKLFGMFLGLSGFKLGFQDWIELEREATMIRGWESRWVPGLLQTPDYMAVVLHLDGPEAVAARRARQRILDKEQPPVVRFVIDEYVLRHPVGDASTMEAQLEHLEQVVAGGLAHVQVVPSDAVPGIGAGFALASVNGRTIGYEESTTQATVLTDEPDLHRLEVVYDHLLGEAEPLARSLERIQRVRSELWRS